MSELTDILLHVILPNRCMFCGVPLAYEKSACESCSALAPRTDPAFCLLCGEELSGCVCSREENGFDWYLSPYYYGLGVDHAISDFKFRNNWLTGKKLAADMARLIRRFGEDMKEYLLVPVPLHRSDKRRRGFNQSEMLCQWISEATGLLYDGEILYKLCKTQKQHDLNRQERLSNLDGAFTVRRPERVQGRSFILIDDVFTTGSTMRVCAAELYRAGAVEVGCMTVARTRKAEEKMITI